MNWAIDNTDQRISAQPNCRAHCPICKTEVIPKCGAIVIWHWAHKSLRDCDEWYEPESVWHVDWKRQFPNDWQEVVIGNHRADVKTPSCVIELQASSISSEDVTARENFYGAMVWILKGTDFDEHFEVRESSRYAKKQCVSCKLKIGWPMADSDAVVHGDSCPACGADLERVQNQTRPYWTFRWKHPRKTWSFARRPVGIDFGEGMIFWIKRAYWDERCAGWGIYETHNDFISRVNQTGK